MRTCSAPDCDSRHYCKGFCTKHYMRMRRTGDLATAPVLSLGERLAVAVQDDNGCWIWPGVPGLNGYARLSIGDQLQYAHRVSYEHYVGPIPDELTIDHLCRVRMCINPEHLEPVTRAENARRGNAVRWAS